MEKKLIDLKKMVSDGNSMIARNEAITADFLAKLDELNGEYAKAVEAETYKTIGATDNPILEAVKAYSFKIQRATVIKDPKTKQIAEFRITERDKQIDLLKFCKANEIDAEWNVYISILNQALCMRVAEEIGMTKSEINEIAQSYYMKKAAQKIAEGKPAISNNELCKRLQNLINDIFASDEFKCNNHDVKYLILTYARKGKKALSVAVSRDGQLCMLIADVLHRIATDGKYSVDYKRIESKPEKPKKSNQKVDLSKIDTATLNSELEKRFIETMEALEAVA
jgi:hypothetical protein